MIEKLDIKGTRDTPELVFDPENNIFKLKGNSMPEDSMRFYIPIFDWIEEYIKSPNKSTHLICDLEYFNSTSAKMIYQVFNELEKIKEKGSNVNITWYYNSGDILIEEKGIEYQSILNIPFELVEKS